MCKLPYLVALVGIVGVAPTQAADAPAELPLPTQLRELDREYSNGLESLLTKAKVQDDKALIEDIQARLAVVAKYRTVAPQRQAKSLVIVATLRGEKAELHLSRQGIAWREVSHPPLVDILLNGTSSDPKWDCTGHPYYIYGCSPQPPVVDSVVSHASKGQVTVTKVDRGPGKYCLRIAKPPRTKGDESVTFRLLIKYLPPPTAAGSDGAKEPEVKKE
jgi:hypothetical protein